MRNILKFRIVMIFRLLPVVLVLAGLSGCASSPADPAAVDPPGRKNIDWAKEFKVRDTAPATTATDQPDQGPAKPRFKSLSPLDTELVSLSFVQENAAQVLQLLAHAASLNLVMTEGFGSKTITAEYLDMPVREILDSVCRMLNVVWNEESGTIYVEQYAEKTIDLDFLSIVRKSNFGVGGDVLGGSASGGEQSASVSPLSGNFQIEGGAAEKDADIYENVEKSVEKILGSDGTYALNRQTGTLMVRSSPKTIKSIEGYLQTLRTKYQRQVLIEAKVIEVNLDHKHEFGIDWRSVGGLISNAPIHSADAVVTIDPTLSQSDSYYTMSISSKYSDITGIFRALEEYGDLSVLSNPRLKAMNGQSALISVGQSVAYVRSLEQTTTGTGEDKTVDITTEVSSVFDGMLLGVTPVIEANNVVALHVVPIKSDLVELDTVDFNVGSEPYQLTLPKVNLREMSTVARVKSGDIVLLGGLIMEVKNKGATGLPYLANSGFFGWLFGVQTKETKKVELVVALQVHVVDTDLKAISHE